jgi:ubiquinone/menaquinone biosynthesis C-methylase UbiE
MDYELVIDNDWQRYGKIATIYDMIMVPNFYTRPARDLLATLTLPQGSKVLDVGTGTGVTALMAKQTVGAEGLVVGLDVSIGMLRHASKKGISTLVRGAVPGLPHPDGVFDGVMACFVLNHIQHCEMALYDMVRVLRPTGKVGILAWSKGVNKTDQVWQIIADKFVTRDLVSEALRQALPSEDWLSNPDNVKDTLRSICLEDIEVKHIDYKIKMAVKDYFVYKNHAMSGRLIRSVLTTKAWEQFKEQVANELHHLFGKQVEFKKRVHLTIGVKPKNMVS